MDAIEALVRSLPGEAHRIRRRYWRDPEFRTLCEDYRDALQTLAKLDPLQSADAERAEEYRQLAVVMLKGDRP